MDRHDEPRTRSHHLDSLVEEAARRPGSAITAELTRDDLDALIERLRTVFWSGQDHADVVLVLGAAATTVADAIAQFVAALRLPYRAAGGWDDFDDCLGDLPASRRDCVVVADADRLLISEPKAREDFVARMLEGPTCMGGGWRTLVLVTIAR